MKRQKQTKKRRKKTTKNKKKIKRMMFTFLNYTSKQDFFISQFNTKNEFALRFSIVMFKWQTTEKSQKLRHGNISCCFKKSPC